MKSEVYKHSVSVMIKWKGNHCRHRPINETKINQRLLKYSAIDILNRRHFENEQSAVLFLLYWKKGYIKKCAQAIKSELFMSFIWKIINLFFKKSERQSEKSVLGAHL